MQLARLKVETSALHLLAEQHVRILDADATVDDYRRYLRALWGYHAPLEEIFAVSDSLTSAGFEPAVRMRAPLAAADLSALADTGPWPRCPRLPELSSLPRLLGAAYVLEGSTLGGRFILRALPPAVRDAIGPATRFLVGYGDDTGRRWKAFGTIVDTQLRDEHDLASAVQAARATFACLIDWLALHDAPDARRGLGSMRSATRGAA